MATCPNCNHTFTAKRKAKPKVDPVVKELLKIKFPSRATADWQLAEWRRVMGRDRPQTVQGPLMPPDEVGRLAAALGKVPKSLNNTN